MRVTMLVRCLAMMRGGGETRHLAWARELRQLGVDVDIITGRPLLAAARYPDAGAQVTMLRSPYTRDFVYRNQNRRGFGRLTSFALHADEELFCRAAWRMLEERGRMPDVVHAHALHQAARLRRRNVPVVINLPGEPHARYKDDLAKADALIGDGWAAEQLPSRLGLPVEPVSKGVDAQLFNPEGANLRAALKLEDKRIVVAVARLVPIKNLTLLVDAFAAVHERVARAHLLVAGEGPDRAALRNRAAALEIGDSITFLGAVPHHETPLVYRTGNVFALSSNFDNSPNAVLEAMACGLPVVSTDVGGVREFVTDRVGGEIVAARDSRAMADALERLLASVETATAYGAHNRRRASSEFTWQASAQRLLEVYQSVAAQRTSA
jgi:glycosyltransferase involved in cell wall biosynthesis